MKTDWDVLKAIKRSILNEMPEYFKEQEDAEDVLFALDDSQVVIDDYDIDNLPAKVSVFIAPDYEALEQDTVASSVCTYTVNVYCICKGMSKADLVRQAQSYKASMEHLFGCDQTLNGEVDFLSVTDSQWFSGVEGVGVARGYKLTLSIQWQKTY